MATPCRDGSRPLPTSPAESGVRFIYSKGLQWAFPLYSSSFWFFPTQSIVHRGPEKSCKPPTRFN
jgi:hypothetical protein